MTRLFLIAIYVLQKYVGTVDRGLSPQQLNISLRGEDSLVVVVENQGRINYGGQMNENRKVLHSIHANVQDDTKTFCAL